MSEKRNYRKFTPKQKAEIVLAGLRGERSVRDVCREHEIAETKKRVLSKLGISHRRGGYRDPESQAFIESWFGKLKERLIWRTVLETLEQARAEIGAYIDRYHHRPHSGLGYRTPKEVRQTWDDAQTDEQSLRKEAA